MKPTWKPTISLLVALCLLTATGCTSLPSALERAIPNGSWESVESTVTGKFSATKVSALGVVKDGQVLTAKELHVRHSNIWVPLIEINAVGFVARPPTPAGSIRPLF